MIKSWVATNIDVGLAEEDHRAAVVHVRCTMPPQGLHRRPHMRKLVSLHVDVLIPSPRLPSQLGNLMFTLMLP